MTDVSSRAAGAVSPALATPSHESRQSPRPTRLTKTRGAAIGLGLLAVLASGQALAAASVAKDFLQQITGPIGGTETAAGTVNRGDVVTMKIDVLNSANLLTAGTLTDTLPTGMVLAAVPNPRASSGCGGGITFTAAGGAGAFGFASAQVPAQVSGTPGLCSVYVEVAVPLQGSTPANTTVTLNNTIVAGSTPASGGFTATDSVNSSTVTTTSDTTRSLSVRSLNNLTASKSFSPSTVNMGETSTIQIVLTNPNSGVSVDVTQLSENLPGNLVAAGTTPTVTGSGSCTSATASASGTSGNTTIAFTGLTLAPSASCTVNWVVRGLAANGAGNTTAPAANTVPANSVLNSRSLPQAATSATLTVQAPLNPGKAFSPSTAAANQPVDLMVTLQNRSSSQSLSAVAFSDALPAGMSLIATSVTGSAGCGSYTPFTPAGGATTLAVSGLTIAPSATCTLTASVTTNNDGIYANTISLVDYTSDNPNVGTRQSGPASDTLTVYDQITVGKAALDPRTTNSTGAGSVAPGNLVRYRLTINNYTSSIQAGLTATDPLPLSGASQVVFLTSPAPTFSNCGSTVVDSANGAASAQFSSITIPAGSNASPQTCTIDYHVQLPTTWPVSTAVVNGTTGSPITVTQGGPNLIQGGQPNTSSSTVAPFTQTKAVSSGSVFQGGNTTVTVTLSNNNYVDLANVSLLDSPLFNATGSPSEVTLASPASPSTTCSGVPAYNAVAGSTSFQVSGLTVPQRGSCTVSFQVRVVVPGAGYVNTIPTGNVAGTATINGTPALQNPASAATASLTVNSVLSVAKSFSPAAVSANNGTSRVTVVISNLGAQSLTNLQVVDPLPTSLQLAASPNPSTSCAGNTSFTAVPGASSATLAGATVAGNGSCLFQFDVVTNGNGGGAASVNTIPANSVTADNGVFNASPASGTLTKIAGSSVNVTKSFTPTTLTSAGQTSRLQVVVDNSVGGAVALSNLGLTDNLPSGMTVAAVPASSTTCSGGTVAAVADGTTVALAGASLAAGSTCVFESNVTLVSAGTFNNTIAAAAVRNAQGVTNTNPFTANLQALAALGVAKSFNPTAVTPNSPSRLTIRLINSQALQINLLGVTDVFPTGVVAATPSAASTTCSDGAVAVSSDRAVLTSGTLAAAVPGSSTSCEVSLNVVAPAVGSYVNTIPVGGATGTDSGGGPTQSNASTSATLNVRAEAPVTKSFASANVRTGQSNRLSINIANTANTVALTGVALQDNLPANVTVAQTPNATTTNCGAGAVVTAVAGASIVQLSSGSIAAGATCVVAVDVLSNTPGSYTNTIPDSALQTAEGVSNPSPAVATFTTFEPPTVGKEFNPVQIASGGVSKLRIVLGNINTSPLTMSAAMTDTLPTGLTLGTPAIDSATADALPRCPGISGSTGNTDITVASGGAIPAGGCVVIANVTGTVAGQFTNTIPAGALQTNGGNNQGPAVALLSISTRNSIVGKVYLDANNDGTPGAAEAAISAQSVVLERLDAGGTVVETFTTTTNSLGNYAFVDLPDSTTGSYRVRQPSQPAGTLNGITSVGTLGGGTATGVSTAPSQTSAIALNGGQNATGYNFGELLPVSVAGKVFLDLNNNGTQQSADSGLGGVTITLQGTNDLGAVAPIVTTTAADGSYSFTNLRPGTYSVTEGAQPAGTANGLTVPGTGASTAGTATSPAQTPSAFSGVVLSSGQAGGNFNFAEIPSSRSISGRLYLDQAGDNLFNTGDTAMAGLVVTLSGSDVNGQPVSRTATTGTDGRYSFTGLPAGTYAVIYNTAASPALTTLGSAIPGSTGGTAASRFQTTAIDLTGQNLGSSNNDFTRRPPGSISGTVFADANNNGLFEAAPGGADAPIPGVLLTLTGVDFGPDGTEGNGDDVTLPAVGASGAVTTTTLADGSYSFANLRTGRYNVVEPTQPLFNGVPTINGITSAGTVSGTPAGTAGTATAVGTTPSIISGIVLPPGGTSPTNNFGEFPGALISGRVYGDANNNGSIDAVEGGIAGVTVQLSGTDYLGGAVSSTAVTAADGSYSFIGLRPGTYGVTEPTQPTLTVNGITTAGTINGATVGTATATTVLPSNIGAIVLPLGGQSINNNFGEIGDSPDLWVSKAHAPAKFTTSNTGTYTITVRNAGQRATSGTYTVSDRLPAGLTLAATPFGTGWACVGAAGASSFECTSSTVVAVGATSTQTIQAVVNVAASAAAASPLNNVVMVDGGGEITAYRPSPAERDAFNNNPSALPVCDPAVLHNACRDPTPVQQSASVSGTVWFDVGASLRTLDSTDKRLPNWRVEIVSPASGNLVAATTTGADGSYRVDNLVPGVPLAVRFRDPASNVVFGYPVNGETAPNSSGAACNEAGAIQAGTSSSCVQTSPTTSLGVVLAPGQNLLQQSLPIDPSGVVYDATTRQPVPGSVVTLTPSGTCTGYDPSTSLVNITSGGYTVSGSSASMLVGADGFYQFLFAPSAPALCTFTLAVTPPSGYTFVSTTIPAEPGTLSPPGGVGSTYAVQPQATAPTATPGPGTTYYLTVNSGSGGANIVHNHIPLDPVVPTALALTKTGDKSVAEVGDTVLYTVTVRHMAGPALDQVTTRDRLPAGFTLIRGTVRVNGVAVADPTGGLGPTLAFNLGPIAVNGRLTLNYRLRVGVGSQQGDGTNRAQAFGCGTPAGCVTPTVFTPIAAATPSNEGRHRVKVTGGVFTSQACVLGKIFVDCNNNHVQDPEELGIPGVRFYFEDGTFLVSDSEGKYSQCDLNPKSHVLKADALTLPRGSRLTTSSNRNLGDANSLFIDLKNGELHRADFIEGSCSNTVLEQVKARRSQGEVRSVENEKKKAPALKFESKPRSAPAQATDSANQPIVKPRTPAPGGGGDIPRSDSEKNIPVPELPLNTPASSTQEAQMFAELHDPHSRTPAMKNRHRLSLLSLALCAAIPPAALAQMAPPIAGAAAPLYPQTPAGVAQPPTALRGESAGEFALNRAVTRLIVEVDRNAVPADGQTPTQVTVRLFGEGGKPLVAPAFVTIETSGGRVLLPGARTDELGPRGLDADKVVPGVQLRVENGVAQFSLLAPMTPQDVRLRVTAGDFEAEGTVSFVPEMREMLAAGLLEGIVNLRGRGSDVIQPVRRGDAFEQDLLQWTREFNNGKANVGARAAFFVKGVIRGDVLLTAAFDSDKETRTRLLRDVRPEEFYPVYGDASLRGADARSADRFYVRLDQNKNYLLYGDFQTGDGFSQTSGGGAVASLQQRSLGAYNRTATGVRAHLEQGNVIGNVFATRDTLRQVVEEFASQGSGPYGLANNGALEGSEKVEVVVRDRNQPSRILATRALVPLVDYSFEPFSGRILLSTLLPAFDEQLNPVSLRVSYEVDQGGSAFWVAGVDVQFKPTEATEIGGSAVNEDNPLAAYRLASANAGIRLGDKTRVVVEVAQSQAEVNTNPTNQNTQGALAGVAGTATGRAWRVELAHEPAQEDDKLEARAFVGRSGTTFVNPAAPLAGGRGEAHAKLGYLLTDSVKPYVEGVRSEDRNVGGGERNAGQLGANIKLTDTLTLDVGLRAIREKGGTLGPVASGAFGSTSGLTGSVATGSGGGAVGFGNQLIDPASGLPIINPGSFVPTTGAASAVDRSSDTVRLGLGWKATDTVTLGGEVEQDFRGDERRRLALGGDYQFAERTKLYGRYERQTGVSGPYAITSTERYGDAFVFGVDSTYLRDTQVFSEYRLRDAFSGRDLQLASGVRNVWDVQEGIRLSTAVERTHVISGNQADATALALGVDYSVQPLWRASTRVELRRSGDVANTVDNETFTTTLWQATVARKLDRDWTGLARNYLLKTDYAARGNVLQDRLQFGVAYRDTDTNRVNALAKVEFKHEQDASNATTGELRTRATILSTHADYHPARPWWLTGRVAAKWQADQFEGGVQSSFRAQLLAGRLVYDITEHWDVGALAALQLGQGARQQAFGLEAGYLVRQNLWLSAGFNLSGFRGDADLTGYEYTQRGAYLRLRFKFDEDLFGGKNVDINRSLDR